MPVLRPLRETVGGLKKKKNPELQIRLDVLALDRQPDRVV